MSKVKIYTKSYCPYCEAAKRLFSLKKIPFDVVDVTNDEAALSKLIEKTGHQTVPQIFIGEKFIGGFDDVSALDQNGELDKLLSK